MAAIAPRLIADQPLRALAAYVLGLRTKGQAAGAQRQPRGAELFRIKGKCLDCHRVNGEGRVYGPDLSDIGQRRDVAWLRRALLQPEADIYDSFSNYRWTISLPDNYLLVELTTVSGEQIRGSRINEDAFSIQVRDPAGRIRSFLKKDIAQLNKQWGKSAMPAFKDAFSPDELDDLVAYLTTLRGQR
jgi:putative heme-binding domain-containing protein